MVPSHLITTTRPESTKSFKDVFRYEAQSHTVLLMKNQGDTVRMGFCFLSGVVIKQFEQR